MKNLRKKPFGETTKTEAPVVLGYDGLLSDVVLLIEQARHASARTVNAIMTSTYWQVGQRIVLVEQQGRRRAAYGDEVTKRLSVDLSDRFGRGFSLTNIKQFRQFYLAFQTVEKGQTVSGQFKNMKCSTPSGKSVVVPTDRSLNSDRNLASRFPLPWSAYVRLLAVRNEQARSFYETEALRGGWSVRQLERQIESQFYERAALSRNKVAMLVKGGKPQPDDAISPEEAIRDPYVLEFLNLKDEYSENDLEEALIGHLEHFLLELGGDFAFVGRQKRLRIDDEWYRVDLLFFHRRLRCLMVVDLKRGKLTHADAGQMHLYLNYAREHWTRPGENPPVGLILCAHKGEAMARYALEGLANKVLAAEYRTALPSEAVIVEEMERARKRIEKKTAGTRPADS